MVVFTKVNVVSMGFYILPTNIAIYKYVCINIEGQITKFIFFNRKKIVFKKWNKRLRKIQIISIHKKGLLGGSCSIMI